ncbi:hypothetical protein H0H92_013468 [Tricholoma furcatifolium]|nr:hypothetical protein H0H92_013468 [Tricholoma furcatifolium]
MKTLISGFVDRPHLLEKDSTEKDQPKLVVVLHDFEQLDITVVKDIFTISSIPSGEKVLEEVLHKVNASSLAAAKSCSLFGQTFFDSHFEPDLIIGPTVLAYLKDYYNRHNSSIDALLNILHIVHLKHFCGESLTLLVKSTPSFELLAKPTSLPFVRAVLARLKLAEAPNSASNTDVELSSIIDGTNRARASVYSRARRMRIGFGILSLVQDFVTNEGYKGLDWGHGIIDVMIRVLQGRGALKSDLKFLGIIVRKLKVTQLARLLESIHIFFNTMPPQVRSSEDEARTQLVLAINALPRQDDNDVTGTRVQVSANFSDWLVQYLNEILIPLDDLPLWDIWYTGASPFPVDLINPSMRATVVAGLLYPRDFAASSDDKDKEQGDPPLWELPDTSILFHRYLDSGKMINIYDWFTSFQLELETQKEELGKQVQAKSRPSSPKKRGGKGKAKVVEKDTETEDDVERWQLELQARFMRAMQELDYLGFLKHTGRKADHVQRINAQPELLPACDVDVQTRLRIESLNTMTKRHPNLLLDRDHLCIYCARKAISLSASSEATKPLRTVSITIHPLINPRVSEGAKQHSKDILDEYSQSPDQPAKSAGTADVDPSELSQQQLGGYKATRKNPNVSQEAKQHATDILEERGQI